MKYYKVIESVDRKVIIEDEEGVMDTEEIIEYAMNESECWSEIFSEITSIIEVNEDGEEIGEELI